MSSLSRIPTVYRETTVSYLTTFLSNFDVLQFNPSYPKLVPLALYFTMDTSRYSTGFLSRPLDSGLQRRPIDYKSRESGQFNKRFKFNIDGARKTSR